MDNIDVSVVIVTYNQENYIGEAIESVVNQKTDYTMEVLVSDDCSTDGTWEIIQRYADKYDFIKPVRRAHNLGFIQNYYETMQRCVGRYIMDCSGDDSWLPGKVQLQVTYMDKNQDVGICAAQSIIDYNNEIRKITKDRKYSFTELLKGKRINCLSNCIRKTVYDTYMSEVEPFKKKWKMEDYPLLLWFTKNSSIDVLDKPLSVYRYVHGSESHKNNLDKMLELARNVYDIAIYFCDDTVEEKDAYYAYVHSIAENYWLFGKTNEYREYYRRELRGCTRKKDVVKYLISLIPGSGFVLRLWYKK